MTTTTDDEIYVPDEYDVNQLAELVIETYGPSARLSEVAQALNTWPEIDQLDDGQQEILAEEVRDEIAARDNGRRR